MTISILKSRSFKYVDKLEKRQSILKISQTKLKNSSNKSKRTISPFDQEISSKVCYMHYHDDDLA